MMRAILRILVLCATSALLGSPALGAPPSIPGQRVEPRPESASTKSVQEYQGLGVGRQLATFAGTVLDINDRPIANVLVDLFIDGAPAGTTVTEGNGYYEINVPYDPHGDTTVLLWYVPQDRLLLPKELVIRESKVSQANALISRCVPRATLTPGHQFRVYLFDSTNRNKDLAELNCLP
ncbi:MAG: carboxypeptidase regulatory-like domain-containing protein [Candidatus Eisenbacteria bacterium]|uniref:Carboxypeptidase regulatory-like domain-containing protein n=1 Tax=Eiseniibacteriota bacterium TaxID=2212470 RepID=A0A538T7C9_UNCEI|nr:MAG: carboxypeptidase regulatory-like domain-containing protein [Candidatus Eisenbacteria bacterium]